MGLRIAAGAIAVTLMLGACDEVPQADKSSLDTIAVSSVAPGRSSFRPGIRFNPATLRPGARVGELVADSVAVEGPLIDSSYVGLVRFRGQIQLSGSTLRHADADVYDTALCFEADSASAARLPRWSGDQRRPWFCFGNRVAAASGLGPPSGGVQATIVIERFTIRVSGSDVVNSAHFVRLIRGGVGGGDPSGRAADSASAPRVSSSETRFSPSYARGCPPRPGNPPVARAAFDVYGDGRGPTGRPGDAIASAIERAGGRVLHRYHIDVVRAELDTSVVRALVLGPDPIAQMAEQVLDTSQANLHVQVPYTRPVTDADSAYIARLGGRVRGAPRVRPILWVDLPDSILPGVMRAPGVRDVRAQLVGCARAGA